MVRTNQIYFGGEHRRGTLMQQEKLIVRENDSSIAELGGMIITAVSTYSSKVVLVIGRPGQPNVKKDLHVGDAILYETIDGLVEVRVISTQSTQATVLLTRVAPHRSLVAGLADQQSENFRFSVDERSQVQISITNIRAVIAERSEFSPEQKEYIDRKLDEMQGAAERLGRKDFITWAGGTLTSIAVSAALSHEAAKILFDAANVAFSWLFGGTVHLLP